MTTSDPDGTAGAGAGSGTEPDRSAPAGGAGPRLRASDADRLATVRVLQDAVARGLLTADEGSERMATAFAAVHRDDLPRLTADLPAPDLPVIDRTPPDWRPLAAMALTTAVEQLRSSLHAPAGRLAPARVAVALLAALALMMLLGSLVGELFLDGGGPGRGGWDRD